MGKAQQQREYTAFGTTTQVFASHNNKKHIFISIVNPIILFQRELNVKLKCWYVLNK